MVRDPDCGAVRVGLGDKAHSALPGLPHRDRCFRSPRPCRSPPRGRSAAQASAASADAILLAVVAHRERDFDAGLIEVGGEHHGRQSVKRRESKVKKRADRPATIGARHRRDLVGTDRNDPIRKPKRKCSARHDRQIRSRSASSARTARPHQIADQSDAGGVDSGGQVADLHESLASGSIRHADA